MMTGTQLVPILSLCLLVPGNIAALPEWSENPMLNFE
jgi:hypothetical protein